MVDISNLFNTTAPQPAAPNVFDVSQNIAANNAKNQYMQAQTSGAMTDQQQKLRAMQASMLGSLAQLPPDKFEQAKQTIIPIANKLNPSVQFDNDLDQSTARMIAMGNVPVQEQPQYGMTQAMAGLFQRLGQQGQPQSQPDQSQTAASANGMPAQVPQGGVSLGGAPMSAGDQAMLAFAKPESLNAMTNAQKAAYESPQGKAATEAATTQAKNSTEAAKGVAGIDSRIQNAINILNDQIDLAPKTASGKAGEYQVDAERNLANLGENFDLPTNQTKFEQNNANLFTQELPAIISGMPGSRLDIPLVNAIKKASAINEYGTTPEKIASAQNLKGLLQKYQQNTHQNAQAMGAGNIPIPAINDRNPLAAQGSQTQNTQKIPPGISQAALQAEAKRRGLIQ